MNKLFKTAFTLIELLVVIAIIGILSGLIVISMSGVTNKANVAKAQVFSNSLRNSLMLNLVSEWNFNNLTGTVGSEISTASNFVVDGWGSNAGTAYGSPVLKSDSDCITTKCLYFNGSTDYILFQGNNFNFGTEDFTIALWVKPEASTSYHHFFAMPTQATLALKAYGQNKNIYFYTPTFSTNSTITALYKENVWNYIVFTRRSSVAYIYLDGVLMGSTPSFTNNIANDTVNIGNGYTGEYLKGFLDDVRIYNAAVPAFQIKEQYYAGLNKLLNNGGITREEYLSRVLDLNNSYGKR